MTEQFFQMDAALYNLNKTVQGSPPSVRYQRIYGGQPELVVKYEKFKTIYIC